MFDIFKSKQERLQAKVEKFVSLQNEFSGVNTSIDELAIEFATRDSEFKKALEQEKDEFIKGRIESKYQEFIKSHLKNIGTVKREKESLMKAMEKVYSDDPEFQEILAEEKLYKSYTTILSNYRLNKIDLNTCDTLLKAVENKATFPFMQPYLDTIGEALKNKKETGKVKYADNIVFNKEGKLLLLKRSENDKTFAGMYVIPGGHVDLGEDCESASKRELYEEAGIEVEEVQFVGEYEDKKVHIKYYQSHTDKDPVLQQEEIWGYEWVELKDLDNYPMPFNMCENIKKVLNPYDFKQQVVKIKKALEDDLINPSQYKALMRNVLEKAKKAHSGEIRTWGNDRMQKQPDGSWKKLFGSKGEKKEEENEFQKIKDYAERIIKGEKQIERLSPEEEQGRIAGGRANVEATLLIGADAGASDESKEPFERRPIQEELIEDYAKKNNLWIERMPEFNSNNFIDSGAEAKVYRYGNNKVVKINNLSQHEEPIEFLDRIALHNHLFPDTKYEVVGFGRFDGDFSVIVKQPFIEDNSKVKVPKDEIRKEMEAMGFEHNGGNNYISDDYLIEDLHAGNVLNTKYGLSFIDPIIYLNKKVDGYGGKRELGSIDLNKSTESTLQKALEDNLITPKQYDLLLEKAWTKHPVGTVVTRKDGTRWKKISETGNSKADWKQITKDKGSKPEDAKEAKNSAKEEGQTQNPTNLAEAAKNASETALNEAIKTSGDENIRQAAHEELNRREKEEKVQEEPEKKEGEKTTVKEENEHVEKFRQLPDDQIKFYLEAPYPKVKEAAKMVADERGLSVVSKEDYIKSFEDFDENPETNEDYFYKNDSRKSFDYLEKNEDISSSLSSYKFDGFLTIREYLSDTDSFSKENEYLVDKLKKDTDNISKFIKDNPLSKNLTLHRRCLSDSTFFTKLKEGDIYEDKSFSSTSLQQRAEFGDFHIKILAKSGSRVSNINNKREFEYLIDKGSKFRVIEKHENGLGITVELL